jgi:hypothetical protein
MFIYVFIILIYNFIYFALAYKIAVRFQNVSLKYDLLTIRTFWETASASATASVA